MKSKYIAHKILEILEQNNHQARIAGGAVRDLIMDVDPKDFDIATTALSEQVISIFKNLNYEVIETGLQHGTVTVVIEHIPFEITTLRIDKNTDGRHAEVEFTDDWKLDAMRRDFTINAMYLDRHGEVYDYFGGKKDISEKSLKFVGIPDDRIKEDYLRIMRFFRFAAKYGFTFPAEDIMAIYDNVDGLKNISKERIYTEVKKIVQYDDHIVYLWMNASGVSELIFGNTLNIKSLRILPEWELNLYSMGVPVGWFIEYKASREEIKNVQFIRDFNFTEINYDTFINGFDRMFNWSVLKMPGLLIPINIPKFPINGDDLIVKGYKGKELGDKLTELKRYWAKNNFEPTKNDLMEMI